MKSFKVQKQSNKNWHKQYDKTHGYDLPLYRQPPTNDKRRIHCLGSIQNAQTQSQKV